MVCQARPTNESPSREERFLFGLPKLDEGPALALAGLSAGDVYIHYEIPGLLLTNKGYVSSKDRVLLTSRHEHASAQLQLAVL